jgi:hypothetical protein
MAAFTQRQLEYLRIQRLGQRPVVHAETGEHLTRVVDELRLVEPPGPRRVQCRHSVEQVGARGLQRALDRAAAEISSLSPLPNLAANSVCVGAAPSGPAASRAARNAFPAIRFWPVDANRPSATSRSPMVKRVAGFAVPTSGTPYRMMSGASVGQKARCRATRS